MTKILNFYFSLELNVLCKDGARLFNTPQYLNQHPLCVCLCAKLDTATICNICIPEFIEKKYFNLIVYNIRRRTSLKKIAPP